MDWSYVSDHWSQIMERAWQHTILAGVPLVLGLLIALPLGWLAARVRWLKPPLLGGSGLLYTIPSLALFVLMPVVLGTSIIARVNVIVAMTIYTLALLVRTVADALEAVPNAATQAATAMGYAPARRFLAVDLPLATPVIASGLRVAAVSNVSIVSVASLIGVSNLGIYLTSGYDRQYWTEIWVGLVSCILLAIVFDVIIQVVTRLLTPWQKACVA
ncbi:ABC transporter permease [Luteipulveratus flavus]|uniref:ABC transporter permease n=1 Tax=Luteipulveratus flavus TaxID=3031728 RepID=A0ABT6C2P3_9MICO|nr:ABC transporter permease [Luteipulveratus sp. YIM 133296]MDF8262813.1 ABC transporter permease [Luteipulveratus sp. YIM 133296]